MAKSLTVKLHGYTLIEQSLNMKHFNRTVNSVANMKICVVGLVSQVYVNGLTTPNLWAAALLEDVTLL